MSSVNKLLLKSLRPGEYVKIDDDWYYVSDRRDIWPTAGLATRMVLMEQSPMEINLTLTYAPWKKDDDEQSSGASAGTSSRASADSTG